MSDCLLVKMIQKQLIRTGEGREINRHNYSLEEIDREVKQGVVVKLIELIKFRNTHPAFNGKFMVGNCDDQTIDLSWKSEDLFARLVVKLQPLSASILSYKNPNEKDTSDNNLIRTMIIDIILGDNICH